MSVGIFTLLDRHSVRKAALDAGFDILTDSASAVSGQSSYAPIRCNIWPTEAGHYQAELSMPNVCDRLAETGWAAAGASQRPEELPKLVAVFNALGPEQLEALLHQAWLLSRALPNELEHRFATAVATELAALPSASSKTEREATVKQRVGQQLFREGLMSLWGGRCAITGITEPKLLRASHAKPWADSTDAERLDVYNGLLLAAHLDAAFDAGLITIAPDGLVIVSPRLDAATQKVLGLDGSSRYVQLASQHHPYMAWHQTHIFSPC